jgi:asparagine synthase (glutamine-hydrolysing)
MTGVNARLAPAYRLLPPAIRHRLRGLVVNGVLPMRLRRALSHTVLNHDDHAEQMIFDNWFGIFTPDLQREFGSSALLQELEATDVYASHRRLYEHGDGRDVIDRMLYTDVKSNLVELLMKQDQMSMAVSIESRVPFLDHKLVEFAARVPARYKIRGRAGKHVLKRALRGYLPAHIVNRPKQGFPVPFEAWLVDQFLDPVSRLLLDRTATERGWVNPTAVRRLLEEHRAGRRSAARQIWCLLTLELWARMFLDGDKTWRTNPGDIWESRPGVPVSVAV